MSTSTLKIWPWYATCPAGLKQAVVTPEAAPQPGTRVGVGEGVGPRVRVGVGEGPGVGLRVGVQVGPGVPATMDTEPSLVPKGMSTRLASERSVLAPS